MVIAVFVDQIKNWLLQAYQEEGGNTYLAEKGDENMRPETLKLSKLFLQFNFSDSPLIYFIAKYSPLALGSRSRGVIQTLVALLLSRESWKVSPYLAFYS